MTLRLLGLLGLLALVAACNTVEGMGADIQQGGAAIENEANEVSDGNGGDGGGGGGTSY
jgi:predicted small secreted protein